MDENTKKKVVEHCYTYLKNTFFSVDVQPGTGIHREPVMNWNYMWLNAGPKTTSEFIRGFLLLSYVIGMSEECRFNLGLKPDNPTAFMYDVFLQEFDDLMTTNTAGLNQDYKHCIDLAVDILILCKIRKYKKPEPVIQAPAPSRSKKVKAEEKKKV